MSSKSAFVVGAGMVFVLSAAAFDMDRLAAWAIGYVIGFFVAMISTTLE